jgi:hypothetical protein
MIVFNAAIIILLLIPPEAKRNTGMKLMKYWLIMKMGMGLN